MQGNVLDMPIIIYCYKNTREEQKIPFENINELSKYFETEIIEAKDEYTYFETIKKYWKKKEIIIVEHDLVPTKEQILNLIYCKEPFCSYPYFLDYKRKRLSISQLNYNPMINDYSISEYPKGIFPEYADANGIGVSKISLPFQYKINIEKYDVEKYKWTYIDTFLSKEMAKINQRWHLHYPVLEHYHF